MAKKKSEVYSLRADITVESYSILKIAKGKLLQDEKPAKISDVVDYVVKEYSKSLS